MASINIQYFPLFSLFHKNRVTLLPSYFRNIIKNFKTKNDIQKCENVKKKAIADSFTQAQLLAFAQRPVSLMIKYGCYIK